MIFSRLAFVFALLVNVSTSTWAASTSDYMYSPATISMLPEYCKHTQIYREKVPGGGERADYWYRVLGNNFHNMHHYCNALVSLNLVSLRAYTLSATERQGHLHRAVNEITYVVDRAPADYILMPEFLSKRGFASFRLGRIPEAITDLENAVRLKPDYWPPYITLVDLHKQLGDLQKAKQWVERGLESAPNAQALHQKRDELQKSSRETAVPKSISDSSPRKDL